MVRRHRHQHFLPEERSNNRQIISECKLGEEVGVQIPQVTSLQYRPAVVENMILPYLHRQMQWIW
jgi:hypothetical protein